MRYSLIFLLFISINGISQWKSFKIGVRGDTLNRMDMKDMRQGPWVIKVPALRGERGYEEEGVFQNDNKEGVWKQYAENGVKLAEENYRWGKLDGKQYYYTNNGGLLREESWRAMDPRVLYDTVDVYDLIDPTKVRERVVVKNEGYSMKHGKWTYYDPSEGTVTSTETYRLNKLQTDMDHFMTDDDLKPLNNNANTKNVKSDTASKAKAKPQAVIEYEKKNSNKKKVRVRDGATGY